MRFQRWHPIERITNPKPRAVEYIGGVFTGTLSIIPVTSDKELGVYSAQVYSNTPYTKQKESITAGQEGNPNPMKTGAPSPIKYVFYIIKENRTYDQVLGDMTAGNGHPDLGLSLLRCTNLPLQKRPDGFQQV